VAYIDLINAAADQTDGDVKAGEIDAKESGHGGRITIGGGNDPVAAVGRVLGRRRRVNGGSKGLRTMTMRSGLLVLSNVN
jgi:hypothetical protein